ncbi:hypothetical protein HY844_00870 [Candidatus Berkelbacteria bacterium]|nr:hypothetical protein [Candidatus Berkelbacteria bacterium]
MNPYIGITDFTTFEQVEKMLEVFRAHRKPNSKRVLHIGVMMSFKTLNGIETKWTKAFPPKESIQEIFRPTDKKVYYCLHYADYNDDTKPDDIARAIEYAGRNVNGLQLDMPWPDPGIIAKANDLEVILQIGKVAIERANNDPAMVIRRLGRYEGIIHRILLDKSMGQGVPMDANELIPFAQAIKDRFPQLGIVAAGGLGPDTVNLVEPLAARFPDISIDAQGKLRPSGSALDPIDWEMAGDYLAKALRLLS